MTDEAADIMGDLAQGRLRNVVAFIQLAMDTVISNPQDRLDWKRHALEQREKDAAGGEKDSACQTSTARGAARHD